jgi:hypothetical protein
MGCDLPLHHEDAHRHFLPFTNWRFISPVSYWDPEYHGRIIAVIEILFTLAACGVVSLKTRSHAMRTAPWCPSAFIWGAYWSHGFVWGL